MNDQELRERFAELRAFEHASAPAFELPEHRMPRQWRVAGASTALVAAAAVVILLLVRDAQEAEMSITDWVAPTDVLLQMPGTEWLGEMPTLTSEELP